MSKSVIDVGNDGSLQLMLAEQLDQAARELRGAGRRSCVVSLIVPEYVGRSTSWPAVNALATVELLKRQTITVFVVGNGRTDSAAKAVEWALHGVPE